MDDSSSAVYHHASLDRPDSIRLLELQPGDFDQPLHCLLRHHPHNHEVPYEALSYTWDAPIYPERIYVGVEPSAPFIPITQNLCNALQHLRNGNKPRTLWIDALCINQSDLEEKGHQVAHMGRLYSAAEDVIVWLGLSRSKRIPEILQELLASRVQLESKALGPLGSNVLTEVDRLLTRLQATQFFQFAWFFRVWTVQEFVLAKQVWFQIGPHCCDESTMRAAFKILQNALSQAPDLTTNRKKAKDMNTIRFINDLLQIRGYCSCAETASPQPNSSPLTLAMCASSLARHRLCTDKRDRIYGMLAIARSDMVHPDYHISADDLFFDVAKKSLLQGDFSVLHEHSMQDYKNDTPLLLSAFEPSNAQHSPVWRSASRHAFQASIAVPAQISVLNANQVTIAGSTVDCVLQYAKHVEIGSYGYHSGAKFSERSTHVYGTPKNGLVSLIGINNETILTACRKIFWGMYQTECSEWHKHDHHQEYQPGAAFQHIRCQPYMNERLVEVIIRTMVADSHLVPKDVDIMEGEDGYWSIADRQELLHRSLFKTQRGYLGLGSRHLRAGDLVVLFYGAKTPFILRREVGLERQWTGRYKLVDDCYLHGWMDGNYFGHTIVDEDGNIVSIPSPGFPGENQQQTGEVLKKQQYIIC